jgi:general stress protein YciG
MGQPLVAGTKAGAAKATAKILARDPNFFKRIGKRGGSNGNTGGFAANRELASVAGTKGGRISRRGRAKTNDTKEVI